MNCDACGNPITVEYRASVVQASNGRGQRFRLCKTCAMATSFAMQAAVKNIGEARECSKI